MVRPIGFLALTLPLLTVFCGATAPRSRAKKGERHPNPAALQALLGVPASMASVQDGYAPPGQKFLVMC